MVKQATAKTQSHQKKLVSIAEAVRIAARLRKAGRKVVTTNGVFDILHVGHARSLAFARAQGDALFVGINSDASVRRNKGKARPIVPARERAEMLAALEAVNYVFIFNEATPLSPILKIHPDVHVKSSEYTLDQIVGRKEVEAYGGKVLRAPHTGKHSTTQIIKKIQKLENK